MELSGQFYAKDLLTRRVGGPKSQVGSFGRAKSLASAGIRTSDLPVRSLVTVPATLSRSLAKTLVT